MGQQWESGYITDREKVDLWLDHIGEYDIDSRNEVLSGCANGMMLECGFSPAKAVRAYYVHQWEVDCKWNQTKILNKKESENILPVSAMKYYGKKKIK